MFIKIIAYHLIFLKNNVQDKKYINLSYKCIDKILIINNK